MTGDNTAVLFGANGISPEGHCGHTSGHLMVTIVAKHYKIPVIVIADSFKKGEIEWNPSLPRKGDHWLTGQKGVLRNLRDLNIRLVNYREDKIESGFISECIQESETQVS